MILLFPDGRLPRRWRVVLWAYLADATGVAAFFLGTAAWNMGHEPVAVDGAGQLIKLANPPGVIAAVVVACAAALPVFWVSFVARQGLSWRRASGERIGCSWRVAAHRVAGRACALAVPMSKQ